MGFIMQTIFARYVYCIWIWLWEGEGKGEGILQLQKISITCFQMLLHT